jgi:hypothetical protein
MMMIGFEAGVEARRGCGRRFKGKIFCEGGKQKTRVLLYVVFGWIILITRRTAVSISL